MLWDENCRNYFYDICDHFFLPLYNLLYGHTLPIFSQSTIEYLNDILDLFIDDHFSYIRVYGYYQCLFLIGFF